MNTSALKNWIPYQLLFKDEQVLCNWLFLNEKPFTEPFFDETIMACRQFNSSKINCVSTPDFLPEAAATLAVIEPSVFIFHVSRCGSTLASQLLSLDEKNIVLSEVPFFDTLIRWKYKSTDETDLISFLKDAIKIYGQKRNGKEEKLIIKTDSWHVLFYEQLRNLFPQTPFVLLYRNPAEVIRSHKKRRGMQAVPGLLEPQIFGFDTEEINQASLDEYMAKVLEKYFEKFTEIINPDKNAFAINYNEGAVNFTKKIAAIANISLTEKNIKQIELRANYHGKYPGENFYEENTEEEIPFYLLKSMELYRELEERRIFKMQNITD